MPSIPVGPNIDDISESIRDPENRGPMKKAVGFLGRKICDAIGAVEDWVNDAGVPVRDFVPACRDYWDDKGQSGPIFAPPFTGGQCAKLYRLFGNTEYDIFIGSTGATVKGVVSSTTEYNILGPITGFSYRYDTPGSTGNRRWILDVGTATGVRAGVDSELNPISSNSVRNARFVGVLQVAPGQVDDCGNPPSRIIPGPNPTPTPPTPLPPTDRPFNDPVTGPSIPIPPIPTIPGLPNLPGFDPFGGGGGDGGSGGQPPGDIGSPGSPGDTGVGGEEEGEAPPNSVLVGVKVDILEAPSDSSKFDPEVWRGACYVYMGVPGNLGLDATGVALRTGQFFFAQAENLTAWRVSANVGFSLRVTPYYRELEAEIV